MLVVICNSFYNFLNLLLCHYTLSLSKNLKYIKNYNCILHCVVMLKANISMPSAIPNHSKTSQ